MNNQSMVKLYVTHVDHIGPYLKIWGQQNRNAVKVVQERIQTLLPTCFEIGEKWSLEHQQALLLPGTFCIFKRKNNAEPDEYEFLRARVLNAVVNGTQREGPLSMSCEVEFIDFGQTTYVNSRKLLFPKQPQLLDSSSLCSTYIVLGICAEWNKSDLEQVMRLILKETVDITIKNETNNQQCITVMWKDFDLAEFLMEQKKIGASIDHKLQLDHLEKIIKDNPNIIPHVNKTPNNITNNNNYYYKNNNDSQFGKTATDLAREQLMAQRSLSARLEKHRNPQIDGFFSAPQAVPSPKEYIKPSPAVVSTYSPRVPPTLGTLHSMVQGIRSQNNRLPMTGLGIQTNQHYNRPQMSINNFGLKTGSNPMDIYYARYKQPQMTIAPAMPLMQFGPKPHLKPIVLSPTSFRPSFKSSNLVIGQTYDVTVSYVENGPYAFSVQLRTQADELTDMMNRLESVKLVPLNSPPYVSMACLARYSEDNQIYRALISGVYQTSCRVLYVDYGNSETVTYRDLYLIPHDYLEERPFSMRFMLSGSKQLEPIDDNLKKAFKDFILYGNFKLTVMPLEGPPLVQYCQLTHDGVNIINMLREIKQTRLIYPKADPLKNDDMVEIRYIDSPKHFYVQKQQNIPEFEKLMDEMFVYYNTNQVVPKELCLGAPCIVKYDKEWYRAEVMRADAKAIVVRHVDFGYEQRVTKNLLSTIAEKHIKMPRQAVQCCLKGFENNELNKAVATDQFEMLAEESNLGQRRLFTVRVFRIQPDGLNIVNLISKNLNVMKKLYKLCMPFEQYLSLEKEEFNTNSVNINLSANHSKTPSIASSNEGVSLQSSKKGILNSTTLQSDERLQNQQQHQKPQKQQRSNNNNNKNDWDKMSRISSSRDNRDSRSLSSDQQSQPSGGRKQQHDQSNKSSGRSSQWDTSFDSQSNGSVGSSLSTGSKQNKKRNGEVPPRFQNGKQEAPINSRFNKNQSPRKQQQEPQQQKHNQRPQNAPQGYSQKPQRQKSTLNASSVTKKSSNSETSSISSDVQQKPQPEVYVPLEHAFPHEDIKLPANEEISICWWISPYQFYVQRKTKLTKYEQMLREMQSFYKQKPHQQLQLKVGSSVVARYRKDNIIQRARILACNHMLRKYKVYFVDMGNQYTVTSEDIWQVEKRFSNLSCMAYRCSFEGIVSNYDHLYIVDRMDKHLPACATIKCEFVKRYNDTYNVNVLVNGVSLKESLKNSGLITEVAKETRIDLLAGQQIRAKITSIRDMLNFKIQLEGFDEKVQFLCSFHDLRYVKSNPDIAKKFKQFYEGKSCIVNVKDVNDNNVILLRPMMPLFKDDIPSNICTYPVLLDHFQARVVFIDSLYRLYVQPLALVPKMETLLNEMYTFYQEGGKVLTKLELDQFCAANGTDGNWYRARLISCEKKDDKKRIKVFYVDYGNTEELDSKNLKVLDERFYLNASANAVEVNLPIGRVLSDSLAKSQTNGLLEQEVIVKPIEVRRNHIIADVKVKSSNQCLIELFKSKQLIKSRDIDYMRKLLEKEKSNKLEYIETVDLTLEDEDDDKRHKKSANTSPKRKKQPKEKISQVVCGPVEESHQKPKIEKAVQPPIESVITHAPIEPEQIKTIVPTISEPEVVLKPEPTTVVVLSQPAKPPTPVDPYADMETAALSHCDNPAQFYVHPQDTLDQLVKLQENLQIVSPALPQLKNVVNGAECISLYSVDKQWYRAKILDAELMVLQFIDFGNTDCVTDTTDVKESMWTHVAPYCLPCALPIRPKGTADWVDAANAVFNDSYNKILHYEYITRGDHKTRSFINLYIEDINVTEKLIADGYAIPLEVVKSDEICYLSHVNSISDFYIQFEKDGKALELIEHYLSNATEKLQPLKEFTKSQIVAALFDEDQLWYRAEILREVPEKGYEVRFIDYGNTSISPECRILSEDIAKVPALSKKCELELPLDRLGWSEEAEQKFSEIAATGETIFTVTLRQPASDRVIVHLLIDDHNIIEDLAPLCAQKEESSTSESLVNSQNTSLQVSSHHENGCQLAAVVTNVNTPLDFYVQFEKDSARIEHITESLNLISLEVLEKNAEIGKLCAARFEEDDALYRARILEVLPQSITGDEEERKQQYRVHFIDFGNESITSELYDLPQDLLELKALAKQCRLEPSPKFSQIPAVSNETFNALLEGCACSVNLEYVDADSEPALVKLFSNDNKAMNICKQLHQLLDSAKSTPAPEKNTTSQCVISHANSPNSFYIQLKKNSNELELIAKALEKTKAAELPQIKDVMEDVVGVCYSQEDDCYYRGMVKSILENNEGYEVFLIDIGSVITTKDLRQMPTEIVGLPCLAVHCTLVDIPTDVENVKLVEAFSTLLESHFGEVFEILKSEPDNESNKRKVQLQIDYKDLGEELAKSVAGIEASPIPTLYDCTVVQFNSPTSFYLQLDQDIPALETVTDKLLDAEEEFPIFEQLKIGEICAAQFPDDEAYYRAELIQQVDNDKWEVHFIDFGNSAVTDKFRTLPPDIRNLQRYCRHCQLDNVSIAKCDASQLQAFVDSRYSETFQAELLTSKEPCVTRLFYQGKNLADEFRQTLQETSPSSGVSSLENSK